MITVFILAINYMPEDKCVSKVIRKEDGMNDVKRGTVFISIRSPNFQYTVIYCSHPASGGHF